MPKSPIYTKTPLDKTILKLKDISQKFVKNGLKVSTQYEEILNDKDIIVLEGNYKGSPYAKILLEKENNSSHFNLLYRDAEFNYFSFIIKDEKKVKLVLKMMQAFGKREVHLECLNVPLKPMDVARFIVFESQCCMFYENVDENQMEIELSGQMKSNSQHCFICIGYAKDNEDTNKIISISYTDEMENVMTFEIDQKDALRIAMEKLHLLNKSE